MKFRRILSAGIPLLSAMALFTLWNALSPTPFSYKGDMWLLGSPISHLIGQSWSSGHIPRIFWSLGDGYNPWLAGQSGVAYPVVTLAYLIGQWLHRPDRIQDWLVVLNMLILAMWVWFHPLLRKLSLFRRWLLLMVPLAHPAELILGQNWLYMHSTGTWCTLVLLELAAWLKWPSQTRFAWRFSLATLFLFTAIHIQLFGFFVVVGVLFALLHPRTRLWWPRSRRVLLLLGGLIFPSYLAIWLASLNANPAWAPPHDWWLPLVHAQSLFTVLKGALLGNLPGSAPSFEIWRGVSPLGQGMFFLGPAVLLAMLWRPQRGNYGAILSVVLLLLIMGIATLPWLAHGFIGPFGSFRWTWKFAIFLPSLSLLVLLDLPHHQQRIWNGALVLNGLMAVLCGVRGLETDFLPSLQPAHQAGVVALAKPMTEVKSLLQLHPEDRILPIGGMTSMDQPVNLAWLGLNGNGPAMKGIGTLALYDNLEPEASARFRGGFSVPWRTALPEDLSDQAWRQLQPLLASRGVRWLLFSAPPVGLPALGVRPLLLSSGDHLWAWEVPGWEPRLHELTGKGVAPPPMPGGSWQVPEGTWTLESARKVSFSGHESGPKTFQGPGIIQFAPLYGYGPLIAIWMLGVLTWFVWGLRSKPGSIESDNPTSSGSMDDPDS